MKESERVKDLCAKCWEWSTYLEWHMDSHGSCFAQNEVSPYALQNKDTKTPL